jgi:hypothetical protein
VGQERSTRRSRARTLVCGVAHDSIEDYHAKVIGIVGLSVTAQIRHMITMRTPSADEIFLSFSDVSASTARLESEGCCCDLELIIRWRRRSGKWRRGGSGGRRRRRKRRHRPRARPRER